MGAGFHHSIILLLILLCIWYTIYLHLYHRLSIFSIVSSFASYFYTYTYVDIHINPSRKMRAKKKLYCMCILHYIHFAPKWISISLQCAYSGENSGWRHVFESLDESKEVGSPWMAKGNCQGWFQGPSIMGPLYGKFPILFPYHSHKNPQRYGNSMGNLP